MNETKSDLAKYENELAEVNKRLTEIDNQRNNIVRVGVRIEGIIAYLKNKEQELLAADKKSLEPAVTSPA
jgi:predicted nucleotide-binding protein (sugar kinase/HSP70/actin superfamily)